jgi:GLPGLI family protein
MKKFGILILAISSQLIFAQANRFVYQVTMKLDSTNRAEIKTETANLDIATEKSIFYGEKRLQRDSLLKRSFETKSFNFARNQMENLRSNIDFIVEKNSKTGTKNFKSRIGLDNYLYTEDRTMDWKILPETAKIGDYKTQKAETNFAGRTWFAWFTTDIPFQDGPYKFSGLPGLIVKVEDSKGDFSFDLKEAKKINAIATFEQRGSTITLKRTDFIKQEKKFKEDPSAVMAVNSGRGEIRIQSNPQERKDRENRMKEEAKKKNNTIELQ